MGRQDAKSFVFWQRLVLVCEVSATRARWPWRFRSVPNISAPGRSEQFLEGWNSDPRDGEAPVRMLFDWWETRKRKSSWNLAKENTDDFKLIQQQHCSNSNSSQVWVSGTEDRQTEPISPGLVTQYSVAQHTTTNMEDSNCTAIQQSGKRASKNLTKGLLLWLMA